MILLKHLFSHKKSIMRALVLLAIVTLAAAFPNPFKQCLASATAFKDSLFEALDKKDADQIIDEVEKVL